MVVSRPGPPSRAGRASLWVLVLGALIVPAASAVSPPKAAGAPGPYASGHVLVHYRGQPGIRKLKVPAGGTVSKEVARLRADPYVSYANPDYVVKAAGTCGWAVTM